MTNLWNSRNIFYREYYSISMSFDKAFYNCLRDPWLSPPAQIADEFNGATCPLKVRSLFSITTNNNGHGALFISPTLDGTTGVNHSSVATVTASTSTIASWTSADHPDATALEAAYKQYRPVSMGIKAFYIGAESATAGTVGIATLDGPLAMADVPTDVLEISDLPVSKIEGCASMTGPLCAALNPFDRPRFSMMTGVNHGEAFPSAVVFIANGAASSACVRVEVTLNLELLPLYTNLVTMNAATKSVLGNNDLTAIGRRLDTVRLGSEASVTKARPVTTYKRKKRIYKKKASYAGNIYKPLVWKSKYRRS